MWKCSESSTAGERRGLWIREAISLIRYRAESCAGAKRKTREGGADLPNVRKSVLQKSVEQKSLEEIEAKKAKERQTSGINQYTDKSLVEELPQPSITKTRDVMGEKG